MNGWGLLFTAAVPWAAMIGWPVVVAKRKGNGAQIDFGLQLTKAHVRTAVLAAVYAYGGAGLVALVIEKVHGPFNSVAGQVASAQRGIVLVVFALTMVTIAPLAEEIAFRGLLYTALCKRGISEIAAVLISAIAFAAFHFEPTRLPLLFAIGVVLGEVRRRTGSTAASVITHVLNNAPSAISLIVTAVGTFLHR
jgi:membrane protease YdiL (CAAX protease family)